MENKLQTGLFKAIQLAPTHIYVDIWICNDQDNIAKYFNKRYGASVEYYKEEISPNQVCDLYSTKESELKGERRIVMNVTSFDMAVIIHELIHVVYRLAKICGMETNYDSQEWISYMVEYLFERCQEDSEFISCEVL